MAARGVLLPQGFPGEWNYWVGPAEGRGGCADRPRLEHVERLQLSLRGEESSGKEVGRGGLWLSLSTQTTNEYGVELEWATLEFGAGGAETR